MQSHKSDVIFRIFMIRANKTSSLTRSKKLYFLSVSVVATPFAFSTRKSPRSGNAVLLFFDADILRSFYCTFVANIWYDELQNGFGNLIQVSKSHFQLRSRLIVAPLLLHLKKKNETRQKATHKIIKKIEWKNWHISQDNSNEMCWKTIAAWAIVQLTNW